MKSLIQYIKQLYINDIISKSEFLTSCTSCELTSIYIVDKLKNINAIEYTKTYLNYQIKEIEALDNFIIEVILFRRSHTFLIVKEGTRVYMISAYLNLYTSHIQEFDDFNSLMTDIYKIEFEDDIDLHNKLFNTAKVPCLSLNKSLSRIKGILCSSINGKKN